MTFITAIEMTNYGPFRGGHRLTLEPKAYGIAAEGVDDAERSNWSGKTTLAELPKHVLYGSHSWRNEDGWISRDEDRAEITLVLSDGARIARTRTRGKRTELSYQEKGKKAYATQDEAQRLIVERIGLDERDYTHSCAFEQRQVARLILAKPADRMAVVSAWLRLEKLEEAHEIARERLARLVNDGASFVQTAMVTRERAKDLKAKKQAKLDAEELLSAARGGVTLAQAALEEALDAVRTAEARAEHAQAEADARAVEAEYRSSKPVAKVDTALSTRVREQWDRAAKAKTRLSLLSVTGKFSGECPVAPIDCPSRAAVDGARKETLAKARVVQEELDEATKLAREWQAEADRNAREAEARERLGERAAYLRKRANELGERAAKKGSKTALDPEYYRKGLRSAQERLEDALRAAGEATITYQQAQAADAALAMMEKQAAAHERDTALLRTAVAILGRGGAQRRVAEGALGEIEAGANAALATCGIELGVRVAWGREGEGLATTCNACGTPYPSSQRVKACARCNAERGPKIVHRLDIETSDRSGAAEDLAGTMVQLAAAAWLRRSRGSAWATVVMDEVFGQLDGAHRRLLSQGLGNVLASVGVEQAFVVAHHAQVVEALPGGILIERDGEGWSRAKVVA
jgi:DNA repair exonuclease SbcCD ATPase subunit